MRLIDADALYKAMQDVEELARRRVLDTESTLPYPTNLNPAYTRYLAQMDERTKAKEMVADAPTVDAVQVRHGKWIRVYSRPGVFKYLGWTCDQCGYPTGEEYAPQWFKFCPNCGARMDGKDGDHHEG